MKTTLAALLASMFIAPTEVQMHVSMPAPMLRYYDPHPMEINPHPFSTWCCNRRDCGFAKPGSVIWTPQGYRVRLPDGQFQLVPEDSPAIRPRFEPGYEHETRFAACIMPRTAYSDKYLDEKSPGATAVNSKWWVRCLYVGRSGQ